VVAEGRAVLGIGVGLPGAVEASTGLLLFAPNFGWRRVGVGARLRQELVSMNLAHVPVYCQNEADLAAIGESEFGPRPAEDPLVYISCGVGLGSGIVLGRTLFTGASGAAGEIGHTTLHIGGAACSCGRKGCAEAYVGLRAIARAAGFLGRKQEVDRNGLRAAMADRDPKATSAFDSAGIELGVVLQNVWATFDPKAIVLGGETVSLGGAAFTGPALGVLDNYAKAAGVPPPTVRITQFTDRATAVGGAAYALYGLMNPYLQLQQ
jgi:predicted NBD/HSP70 family sugar kinase